MRKKFKDKEGKKSKKLNFVYPCIIQNFRRASSSYVSNPFVGSAESDASFDGFISAVLGATTIKDRHQLTNRLTQALDPLKNLQERIKEVCQVSFMRVHGPLYRLLSCVMIAFESAKKM